MMIEYDLPMVKACHICDGDGELDHWSGTWHKLPCYKCEGSKFHVDAIPLEELQSEVPRSPLQWAQVACGRWLSD